MREIKFRGKDILGKWRYGDLVQEKWKSLLNTNVLLCNNALNIAFTLSPTVNVSVIAIFSMFFAF